MADIFDLSFAPPDNHKGDSFALFKTDVAHAESDYKAVMSSRGSLRLWSQSPWPEDDFTLEQNREDLAHHVQDNLLHTAYGYMIYSPDHSTCYGSVYVNPLKPVRDGYTTTGDQQRMLETFDARIDYWTVDDLALELKIEILKDLREWLRDIWKIRPMFSARRGMDERLDLYRSAGLKLQADLRSQTSEVTLLLFS